MKIGIVTITELSNFGNRLQNYALQTILESMGNTVETIPNYIIYRDMRKPVWKGKQFIKGCLKIALRKDYRTLAELKKMKPFDDFDAVYIHKAANYESTIDFITPNMNENYDRFVAGSDQIWNPYFTFNFDFEFLKFADKEKRIAYAASFGVEQIPDTKKTYFQTALKEMHAISVREHAGKRIVSRLIGREVPVVLDPTLLLTKEDWMKIEKKPTWKDNQPFLLFYFLGNVEEKKRMMRQIEAKHPEYTECSVIDIHNPADLKRFCIGPCEFIWLIHHAKLMVTDSFHGSVFSILMETPFISAKRKDNNVSMNSRIESLFCLLELSHTEDIVVDHIIRRQELNKKLERCREESKNYLRNALRGN